MVFHLTLFYQRAVVENECRLRNVQDSSKDCISRTILSDVSYPVKMLVCYLYCFIHEYVYNSIQCNFTLQISLLIHIHIKPVESPMFTCTNKDVNMPLKP